MDIANGTRSEHVAASGGRYRHSRGVYNWIWLKLKLAAC